VVDGAGAVVDGLAVVVVAAVPDEHAAKSSANNTPIRADRANAPTMFSA
jgi:hypothetical protein